MENKYIIGVFDEEEKLIHTLENLKKNEFRINDFYTPYPVHEALHLAAKKSRIPTAAYFYGLFAALAVLAFLYYTSVISYPLHYGGKPFNSFPSFIVVTIVLTILSITLLSLFTFSARSKLYPGKQPSIVDERVSDDKFVIVVEKQENQSKEMIEQLFTQHGAIEIYEK